MLVSSVAPTTEDVPSADTDKEVAVCDGSVEDSCNTLEDDLDEDEGEEVKVVDTGREGEDDGEEDVVAEEVDGVLENVSELVLGAVVRWNWMALMWLTQKTRKGPLSLLTRQKR